MTILEQETKTSAGKAQKMESTMSTSRKAYQYGLKILLYVAACLTLALVLALILYILVKGIPHITWELISTGPSVREGRIGILPNILNTLYVIIITLLVALPLGVGAAVYLTEYARNKKIVSMIELAGETLAGIPSIIYGLVGMLFFCQFLNLKTSLWAGILTLIIMILPTILRTTQESLKTVPSTYREGALALGAGKWHMIRTVVLPSAIDGIVTGSILSIGRIVGESAALLFTAGLGTKLIPNIWKALKSSGGTLSVALYLYVSEEGEFEVGYAIAAILLLIVLVINTCAHIAKKNLQKKRG